jgi:hypothetical protein
MAGHSGKARHGDRANDTLYRRPLANPPVESATGGSWFGGENPGELGPDGDFLDEPGYGPSTTSSRASFGFGDGPISPVRSLSGELPIQGKGGGAPAGRKRSAAGPPAPAARQAVPSGQGWSQSQYGQDESTLDPVSPGGLRAGDSGSWEDSTGWSAADAGAGRSAADTGGWSTADRDEGWAAGGVGWPQAEAAGSSTGEHRAVRREALPEPEQPRQSRLVTIGIALLSTVVLAGVGAAGVVYFSGSDSDINAVLRLGAGDSAGTRTVTAPLDNRTTASFELLAGTNSVHVTIGELGDDLYRISTPDDAGFKPSPLIRNDDVKLQVTQDGDGAGGEIEVVLAAKVRWALRFSGYAETQRIDVSGGQISQIEMVAGMKSAELTLPRPSGTVPLKINGAVDQLVLKSPASSPVRVKVSGGAQTVVAGSKTLKDVAAGSTLTPKGWDTADRYDVTAGARITALTIQSA